MNFLAHLYLAEPTDTSLLGNILGDFVKGPVENAQFSVAVRQGITEHRRIDSYCDGHTAMLQAKALISAPNGRYSGISIDVFFDHFLARDWDLYSETPLLVFADRVYRLLEQNFDMLPEKLQYILPWMRQEDWLAGYSTRAGIARSIRGLSRRLERRLGKKNQFEATLVDFDRHYHQFETYFEILIRDLRTFVAELRLNELKST